MKELEVHLRFSRSVRVGVLAESARGELFFEFDPAFLADGPELSPYALRKRPGLIRHDVRPGVRVPGVFDDARPDGWGQRLIHRAFQQAGRPPDSVSALEELAWLGARTMGALVFHPPSGGPGPLDEAVDLGALARHARQIDDGDPVDVLPALLRGGGSPGGVRPKLLVGFGPDGACRLGDGDLPDGWSHGLVKFPRSHDDPDAVRREWVWLETARAAGLDVPEARVLALGDAGDALAVRRFDRGPAGERVHRLSAAGALDVDFRHASADYRELGRLSARICGGDQRQVRALFLLAAFNVVLVNEDDHLKNLCWLLPDGGNWRVSPAYDLTYAPHPSGFRPTAVCGRDREVGRADLLALAESLGLARADRWIDAVCAAAEQVGARLDEAGCRSPVSVAARVAVEASLRRVGAR